MASVVNMSCHDEVQQIVTWIFHYFFDIEQAATVNQLIRVKKGLYVDYYNYTFMTINSTVCMFFLFT